MEILTTPLSDAMKAAGVTGIGIPEETLFANNDPTLAPPAKQMTVSSGDTILTVAAAIGRDWQEIVKINGLDHPYITSNPMDALSDIKGVARTPIIPTGSLSIPANGLSPDAGDILAFGEGKYTLQVGSCHDGMIYLTAPTPAGLPTAGVVTLHARKYKVAMPGDTILVPIDNLASTAIAGGAGNTEKALFGEDEFLDADGFQQEDSKDIRTISGMQNLAMQLYHRINTIKGELAELGHPEYGTLVPTMIGEPMTDVWVERILLECKLGAEAEPRVDQVGNIKFYNEGTAIFFECDVFPANDIEPFHVAIPIG